MKKSEAITHLDRVSDELDAHGYVPVIDLELGVLGLRVQASALMKGLSLTPGEAQALRAGAIAGLVYARDLLAGNQMAGNPATDAHDLFGDATMALLSCRLRSNDRRKGGGDDE